jgi:hypothetical protein
VCGATKEMFGQKRGREATDEMDVVDQPVSAQQQSTLVKNPWRTPDIAPMSAVIGNVLFGIGAGEYDIFYKAERSHTLKQNIHVMSPSPIIIQKG